MIRHTILMLRIECLQAYCGISLPPRFSNMPGDDLTAGRQSNTLTLQTQTLQSPYAGNLGLLFLNDAVFSLCKNIFGDNGFVAKRQSILFFDAGCFLLSPY